MTTDDRTDTMADITPIVDPLGTDAPANDDIVPEVYHELLSWKNWVRRALPFLIVALMAVIILAVLTVSGIVADAPYALALMTLLVLEAVSVFMTYREYWRWRNNPYYADPEKGVLFQYQAKNKWLFLLGSDPRTLDLDTADYLPKPQTFWENYVPLNGFRHSCTITVDGPGQHDAEHFSDIRDFMYGERISAIILYRKDREQVHQTKDLGFQERQALAAEQTVVLLQELRDEVGRLASALEGRDIPIKTETSAATPTPPQPPDATPAEDD